MTRDIPECNAAIVCCFLPECCDMRTPAYFLTRDAPSGIIIGKCSFIIFAAIIEAISGLRVDFKSVMGFTILGEVPSSGVSNTLKVRVKMKKKHLIINCKGRKIYCGKMPLPYLLVFISFLQPDVHIKIIFMAYLDFGVFLLDLKPSTGRIKIKGHCGVVNQHCKLLFLGLIYV